MRIARIAIALVVALTLQTTLAGVVFQGSAAVDLVLVVVVYFALTSGPVTGLLAGSAAGLVQDALSGGVLGIGGLAKTLVGFLAGLLGTQFILTAPLPRFVIFVLATIVHAAIFMGLYMVLGLRDFPSPYAAVAGQAVGNGVAGVVMFQLMEWLPGLAERRRARRPLKR